MFAHFFLSRASLILFDRLREVSTIQGAQHEIAHLLLPLTNNNIGNRLGP